MAEYSIAYDFGTGSVKAALIGRDYTICDSAFSPYPTYYPHPDFVEQHPEDYWTAFIEVTKKLLAKPGVGPESIRGLVFSQTSSAIIFVDKDGNSLYDCVTWIDSRAGKEADEINEMIAEITSVRARYLHEKNVSPKLLWFVRNRPDVIERAEAMLDPAAYMFLKLSGEYAYEHTGACATCLYDKMERKWNEMWFPMLNFPRRLIPDRVVASSEIVGYVTEKAAAETGLRVGTPVVAGCSDNANGQLGSGCIQKGDVHMYMGSSGWLSVTDELGGDLMPSAVPGMGFHYYCTDSCGTSVDWMIKRFYAGELEQLGSGVYEVMGREMAQRADADEDIIFTPWLYGEEAPVMDAEVRGTILNIKPTTTRGDIARAVAEGIGYNFRWIKEDHEAQVGPIGDEIVLIGGVGQTGELVQIIADIMGVRLITLKANRFAGNVGLAACVDIALGDLADFSPLASLLPRDRVFTPDPAKKARYDKLYAVYRSAYEALKDSYAALAKLRG